MLTDPKTICVLRTFPSKLNIFYRCKHTLEKQGSKACASMIRERIQRFLPMLRLLAISPEKFIDEIMPTKIFTSEESAILLMKIRGKTVTLPEKIKCDPLNYSRILLNDDTLKFAVMTKPTDTKRMGATTAAKLIFIDNFTVSFPVIIFQLQTHENNTLRDSQMTLVDSDNKEVGLARPVNTQWRFLQSVYLYPNKTYKLVIDRALIYSRAPFRKEFTIHSNDVKFRGIVNDNYFRISYWLAHPKNY